MADLDLDFFEKVIVYNAIKNDIFLSSIIEFVEPSYFKNKNIANVFSVVTGYYKDRNCTPSITEIKSRLKTPELKKSFIAVVNDFKTLDKDYNQDELIANTQEYLKQRAVYKAVMDTAQDISNDKTDSAIILKTFEDACNINLFQDYGLDVINNAAELAKRLKSTTTFFSTGYKWLDEKIKGFVTEGKALYVISAATNVGKSIMLTNIACNVARQNKIVFLFTLEMSEEMYGKRIASCLTQLDIGGLHEFTDEMVQSIDEIKKENPEACLYLKEFPTKGATVATIRSYVKRIMSNKKVKPDLIVIDYLNLLKPSVISGQSYGDIKMLTEELRGLTYEFGGVPILTATQLNRNSFNEVNPGIETTSESMGLSMTADVQLSLWANEDDKEAGILHMGLQKNRFGPNFGKTALKINWNNLSVVETEDSVFDNDDLHQAKSILDDL